VSRRKHADHEEHENHERWLITYADMITLLMAFFVMMYGLSILDLKKFDQFKAGVAKQLGKSPIMDGGQGILIAGTGVAESSAPPIGAGNRKGADDAPQTTGDVNRQNLPELANKVQKGLTAAGLQGTVEAETDPRGLVLYVANRTLFKSGSAYLEYDGRRVLDQLALVLAPIDNQVIVEGHTDSVPIRPGGTFPSNWELSTSRATQVLRWMVEGRGLPAVRFSAAGYADTRPRYPNDSPVHRADNRRVEIVVVAADQPGGI
jgi:chemotaxis protein MotB